MHDRKEHTKLGRRTKRRPDVSHEAIDGHDYTLIIGSGEKHLYVGQSRTRIRNANRILCLLLCRRSVFLYTEINKKIFNRFFTFSNFYKWIRCKDGLKEDEMHFHAFAPSLEAVISIWKVMNCWTVDCSDDYGLLRLHTKHTHIRFLIR